MHASTAVATEMINQQQPAELQVLGYTLLQHMVSGHGGGQASVETGVRLARKVLCTHGMCVCPSGAVVAAASFSTGQRSPCRCDKIRHYSDVSLSPLCLPACQVGNRWDDFTPTEHNQLATLAYNMLQQGGCVWQGTCRSGVGSLGAQQPLRQALPAPGPSAPRPLLLLVALLMSSDRSLRCVSHQPPLPCAAAGAASPWAIRSKASLLLALIIKRTGAELWEAALPQLLQAAATEGPVMQAQVGGWFPQGCACAPCCLRGPGLLNQFLLCPCFPAQVCMVTKYVADEIAMYGDDIAVRRSRCRRRRRRRWCCRSCCR